jgi:hypothetical protein
VLSKQGLASIKVAVSQMRPEERFNCTAGVLAGLLQRHARAELAIAELARIAHVAHHDPIPSDWRQCNTPLCKTAREHLEALHVQD